MPRASWTGAIQFGLVNIPVHLERATIAHDVHFHLLHGKDGGRIQHKRICSLDGQEVPFEEVVKGYELGDGKQVAVTPDELALLDAYGPRTIAIEDFVNGQEIDPLYFERAYCVVPENNANARKGYELLRTAMGRMGRVAIARITMRLRNHLCALAVSRGHLTLTTLRYVTEIVEAPEVELPPTVAPSEVEISMAERLIDAMTTPFRPHHYRDDYREHVLSLVRQKAQGATPSPKPSAVPEATSDLAESLAASLKRSSEWMRGARPASGLATVPGEGTSATH